MGFDSSNFSFCPGSLKKPYYLMFRDFLTLSMMSEQLMSSVSWLKLTDLIDTLPWFSLYFLPNHLLIETFRMNGLDRKCFDILPTKQI